MELLKYQKCTDLLSVPPPMEKHLKNYGFSNSKKFREKGKKFLGFYILFI